MIEREFSATIDSMAEVTEFVETALEKAACPMGTIMKINVVVDEIFNNIASYAYGDEGGKATVRIEVAESPNSVVLTFIDSGIPYNPLARENPDITLSAEERNIGGLGIFMVKKIMDKVEYEFIDGHNTLTLTKSF